MKVAQSNQIQQKKKKQTFATHFVHRCRRPLEEIGDVGELRNGHHGSFRRCCERPHHLDRRGELEILLKDPMGRNRLLLLVSNQLNRVRQHRLDGFEALDDGFLAPGQIDDQSSVADAANRSGRLRNMRSDQDWNGNRDLPRQSSERSLLEALQGHGETQLGTLPMDDVLSRFGRDISHRESSSARREHAVQLQVVRVVNQQLLD